MKRLKRRAKIVVHTHAPFAKVTLEFVPGERPYIHLDAQDIGNYSRITGFVEDKDVAKLQRMVNSLKVDPIAKS